MAKSKGGMEALPHPRPQMERSEWSSLNGEWEFAFDADARWSMPVQVEWNRTIIVPFAPESQASGISDSGFYRACWYRRRIDVPTPKDGRRILLHFGAVDYAATVWVNGCAVARHEGGFTPFSADITDTLTGGGPHTIVVRAEDDPHDLAKPRGKQDWQLHPHSIWYPRTTGIWQGVWMETLGPVWIAQLRWTPNVERWEIGLELRLGGERREGLRLRSRLSVGDILLAEDTYAVLAGEVHRRIGLSDPGIDDYRNELLWSPATPTLIDAELQLFSESGELLDTVQSYTALRSINVQGDRFVLNGRPYLMRLVLDQGYWPETGLTAPDDSALRRDVELAKAMGFNGVRKHQKIEDPRYLYWADTLGLLVWEEMPSAYRFTKLSIDRLTREWSEAMMRDYSHPCIVAWVPFNESWGVPDLPDSPAQRHYVQALYHLTKTIDPTRPVIGNDGWESVATDIVGIHDYDDQPGRIARRYASSDEEIPRLFRRERPGGRLLVLNEDTHGGQPIVLSEFGGIAYSQDVHHTWGYSRAENSESFAKKYTRLLEAVCSVRLFAGFCYTQFADTYQETNGLLFADRTPKFPLEVIARATRASGPRELPAETEWRERLMEAQRLQYLQPPEDYRLQGDR